MADNDGDSRMASSPEFSDIEDVETPVDQITTSILSPPDSQHRDKTMPTAAPGAADANANGKRPLNTISNGIEENEVIDLTGSSSKPKVGQEFPPRTHQASGFTWTRAEDEPGYAWLNKKALDERQRALDQVVHKDVVFSRYGDPFEMAEREQATANSLKQR